MPRGIPIELTGIRFGSWVVQHKADEKRGGKVMWVCLCDCSATAEVSTGNLRSGRSSRCRACGTRQSHVTRRKNRKEET